MKIRFKNSLTGLQIMILSILVMVGVMLFLGARPYSHVTDQATDVVEYGFLQKGAYTLEVTYLHSPANNTIVVMSEEMPNEKGQMGVEYAEVKIQHGSGVIRIPFNLEQGTYGVQVKMAQDGGEACVIQEAILQSNNLLYKDNYFFAFLMFVVAVVLLYCFLMLPVEKYMTPMALVGLGLLASLPLLSQSLIGGDDLQFHLTRLEGIYLGLAAGEFPVRITPQQMSGYGGLTATMYPQLFLYPAALLRFLSVSLMNCYKLLLCGINIGTAFSAYYGAKYICKSSRAAMFMSIFYTFSLYRLINLYTRAALGEALAMTFLPLVIWGTYEILWGQRRWMVLVLGMTGILQSHVLSVEMSALFMALELVIWLVSRKKDLLGRRLLTGIKAVVVTLLLNAGFLVPFLYFCGEELQCFMMTSTTGESAVYFSQMFSLFPSVLGKNYTLGSTQGEMPLTVGPVLLLGIVAFGYAYRRGEKDRKYGVGIHCLFFGVLALLLASWIFPWSRLESVAWLESLCSVIQFAWRFLGLASVLLSLTAAIAVDRLLEESESYKWVVALFVGLTLIGAWNIFDGLASEQYQYEDTMVLEGYSLADGMYMYQESEIFEALQLKFHRGEAYVIACNGSGIRFENYERKGSGLSVTVIPESGKEETLVFPIYWYPGFSVSIDGQEVEARQMWRQVSVAAPETTAVIEVEYVGFWFFVLADIVALVTLLGIVTGGFVRRRKVGRECFGA